MSGVLRADMCAFSRGHLELADTSQADGVSSVDDGVYSFRSSTMVLKLDSRQNEMPGTQSGIAQPSQIYRARTGIKRTAISALT